MPKIQIEMIQDVVCSWCALGHKYLMDALKDLQLEAEIRFLPHELNPNMGPEGIEIQRYFQLTHGWTDAEHNGYREKLVATATKAGVNIDFRYRTHYFNTHLAHRLLAEAQTQALANELYQSLLTAYHGHGADM